MKIKVPTGTFTFTNSIGCFVVRDFDVTTIEDEPGNNRITDKRVDDMNTQFEAYWLDLEAKGFTNISYREVQPHPFLPLTS